MVPADQGFQGYKGIVFELDLGLVMESKFPVLQSLPKSLFQMELGGDLGPYLGSISLQFFMKNIFGRMHRHISLLKQYFPFRAIVWTNGISNGNIGQQFHL